MRGHHACLRVRKRPRGNRVKDHDDALGSRVLDMRGVQSAGFAIPSRRLRCIGTYLYEFLPAVRMPRQEVDLEPLGSLYIGDIRTAP